MYSYIKWAAYQNPFSILRPTHIPLINISAGFSNAFQALANDRHHMLLRVWEQDVSLRQLPYSPLIQILQFLVNTQKLLKHKINNASAKRQ